MTHLYRFVTLLVHFCVAQLGLQRPDHLDIQADEAMLTLNFSSVYLSQVARLEVTASTRFGS